MPATSPTMNDGNSKSHELPSLMQSLLNNEKSRRTARPSLSNSTKPALSKESSKRFLDLTPTTTEAPPSTTFTFEGHISKVEQSWYLISDKIERVGLVLMLNLFHEHPELLGLFPFEGDYEFQGGRLKINRRMETHLRAHASAIMRVVGTCVAGLSSMEDLVPKLRTIGSTHRQAGVQDYMYEQMYKHLIAALRDEIGSRWDYETEDAWEQAFVSISDLLKRPSARLETEPLEGYGIVTAVACLYLMVFTPFRLAGFLYGREFSQQVFGVLDVFAAVVLAFDLVIDCVQRSRLKRHARNNRLVGQLVAIVRRLEPWVPWPGNDCKVLLSFILQSTYQLRPGMGLHWTHLFGLLRVATAARVLHFVQCAENRALFDRKLNATKQAQVRMLKLLFKLCFITHLSACLWCIVARFELGPDATEVTPSSFFPDTGILLGSGGILNSYMRAVHWAFVNLAGIGSVDSTPVTTMECFLTIVVHVCGAIFYAIVTGNVIKMLEDASERENKIGADIAKLNSYMDSARVSNLSKERIMKGFMMRNVLTRSNSDSSEEYLDPNDNVLGTLPNYLRQEVAIYARAELIRRRDRFFASCSEGFLVALSSSLVRTRTLLTGDYLLKRGEVHEREFIMVESGSLQVRQEQHTIKILERGDVVGKGWLFHAVNGSRDKDCNEYTDWCYGDGTAGLSIRALCPCTILAGLTNARDIEKLKQGYKRDYDELGAQIRKATKTEAQRRASSFRRAALTTNLLQSLRSFADSDDERIPPTVQEGDEEVDEEEEYIGATANGDAGENKLKSL